MSLKKWKLEPLQGSGTAIINAEDEPSGPPYEYTFARNLVRGVPHPPFIEESVWEAQKSQLKFQNGDVFVCTYSKCGTTLMEQIVLLLLNGGKANQLNPLHKNTLDKTKVGKTGGEIGKVWTEMAVVDGLKRDNEKERGLPVKACMGEDKARMSIAEFNSLPRPRILKTHAPRHLFLADDNQNETRTQEAHLPKIADGVKVIYVTRNPFDACVSCYYHPKPGVSPATTGCPFDAFAKLWLSDRVEFGGWLNHVCGWRKEYLRTTEDAPAPSPFMLWMSYEELVSNPQRSIARVAAFLEVDIESDPLLLHRVVEGCSFDRVKKAAEVALAAGMDGDIAHLRKGKVGDWRNHFSEELRSEFENEINSYVLFEKMDILYDIGGSETWHLGTKQPSKNVTDEERSVDIRNKRSSTMLVPRFTAETVPINIDEDTTRLMDIKVLSAAMIFYNLLQMFLSYVSEFYADDLREKNGLPLLQNFQAVSAVMANILNGISGGLALGTAIYSGGMIKNQWSPAGNKRIITDSEGKTGNYSRFAFGFFVSICFESLVTSGVIHSVAHRLFGATLNGNAWVEFISHLGYTCNVITTAFFMLFWLGPQFLNSLHGPTGRPDYYPRWYEVTIALLFSILASLFVKVWIPFHPDPKEFEYPLDHQFNHDMIVLIQGHVQGLTESVLLVPTVMILFILKRLWHSLSKDLSHSSKQLERSTYRMFILAVVMPLCLNWIHFRCHDDLAIIIQGATGWNHRELIAAIRIVFHIPNWVLAIARLHYFRRLTEWKAGWPLVKIFETICPGGEIFPYLMIFLFRASEGVTLALLPSFFQSGSSQAQTQAFHLDIIDNTWVAFTLLGMFSANAIGAFVLGQLMQHKGYRFTYIFITVSFALLIALLMIPLGKVSFLVLRCVVSLIFPGPVLLSRITQLTRRKFCGALKYVPMVVSLIWFNQGFWFGGAISNSSLWTDNWNVFFYSVLILSILACCVLATYLVHGEVGEIPGTKFVSTRESIHSVYDGPTLENSKVPDNSSNDVEVGVSKKINFVMPSSDQEEKFCKFDDESRIMAACLVLGPNPSSTKQENTGDKTSQKKRMLSLFLPPESHVMKLHPLWKEKMWSFVNGLSFSCHISLLGIQITKLVDLDLYEYTTIVGSLGSLSTVLVLLSFRWMATQRTSISMMLAICGHLLGTAVLSIPNIYLLKSQGSAVAIIVLSYGLVLISFFVMNLSFEVSLGQKSIVQQSLNRKKKDAAAGKEMGYIKSFLSMGKILGTVLVAFASRVHPQLPLWILEGLLLFSLLVFRVVEKHL